MPSERVAGTLRGALLVLLAAGEPAAAQTPDPNLWITNGTVYSVARSGGTLFIGGDFTRVSPATGNLLVIDQATGAPQAPFPMVAGIVMASAPDGDGGWYIGGDFIAVRGEPRGGLAHLDAGGDLTPWNPDPGGAVRALAVSGNTVYVGGYFERMGGETRHAIAAVDGVTGAVLDWNPDAVNVGPDLVIVEDLAVVENTVYACGTFTSIGGQPRLRIAALDASTGQATGWNPNPSVAFSQQPQVRALAVSENIVYVAGYFTAIGGQPRSNLAALDRSTGTAMSWGPEESDGVQALAVGEGTVYVGGQFASIGGLPRNNLAALDATTGLVTDWNPDANDRVDAIAVDGGTVYVGGFHSSVGGQPRHHIAALDAATGSVTDWTPSPNDWVYSLAAGGGVVVAGGKFTGAGGVPRRCIAALDAATGIATSWDASLDPGPIGATLAIDKLVVSGGTVYVGGQFWGIGGQPRRSLAAVDATTGAITSWDPGTGPGSHPFIHDLEVSDGTVYVAGEFDTLGGQPRQSIAALDAVTGSATSWSVDFEPGIIRDLAVDGATVYVGGAFTSIGGQPRSSIAALDRKTGHATSWDPGANLDVHQLMVHGGWVYAGGTFTSIGGQSRWRLAALDPVTGAATGWNPNMNAAVSSLAADDAAVYASGAFTTVGGQPLKHLVALDLMTGQPLDWHPEIIGRAHAIVPAGDRIVLGGVFQHVGLWPRSNLALIAHPATLGVDPMRLEGAGVSAFPNPFSGRSTMRFSLAVEADVDVGVYDLTGRLVRRLNQGRLPIGPHQFDWDGRDEHGHEAAHGIYFVRLTSGGTMRTAKVAKLH